jgi:superfamily I DNA and/or RNA helicase
MGTVDSYQGRQADVVILSLVRSNANGILGFLRNVRRLNVAMSRCMKKLVVISDSTTVRMNRADLQARDALMNYIQASKKLGTYVSLAPAREIGRLRERKRGLAPKGSLSR